MLKGSQTENIRRVTLGLVLVAMCALAIVAQSGRRVRKSEPAPAPTPEATPTPTPAAKPKPTLTLIVGLDRYGGSSGASLNIYSGVLRNCAGRLGDSASVKVEMMTRDMSRSEAVKQAKAEKEAYVVLLQLRSNASTGQGGISDGNLYIQYTVLAPTTAKQVTSGSTFPEAYRNKRIRVPTTTGDGDYYLNQAARGAAERILDHFHIRVANALP